MDAWTTQDVADMLEALGLLSASLDAAVSSLLWVVFGLGFIYAHVLGFILWKCWSGWDLSGGLFKWRGLKP